MFFFISLNPYLNKYIISYIHLYSYRFFIYYFRLLYKTFFLLQASLKQKYNLYFFPILFIDIFLLNLSLYILSTYIHHPNQYYIHLIHDLIYINNVVLKNNFILPLKVSSSNSLQTVCLQLLPPIFCS